MIIDTNIHWLPKDFFTNRNLLNRFISLVPRGYDYDVKIAPIPGTDKRQIVISRPKGFEVLNYSELEYNLKDRLKVMEEAGVDKAILRIPCWGEWADLETAKMINNMLAEEIKEYPEKFLGLAVVPPWGDEESLDELDRAIKDLGLSGIVCSSHYGNLYLDEVEFKPFFKKVNQLDVPVCIHHTPLPVEYNSIYKFANLRRLIGRCLDQLICVSRLLSSGLFEEFPNLKFIHTHIGGCFYAFINMIGFKTAMKEKIERFDIAADKVKKHLEKNVYFAIDPPNIWSKTQLECAVKELGAEHMVFGSSYPVRREWLLKGVEHIKSLEISDKEKKQILGENAAKIFKIK
ncbi:MAG: amidohydrolase family protein [Candidatus Bathyarchaeia archaeon]